MEDSKVRFFDTFSPNLVELVPVLQEGLKSFFAEVDVQLVECPDFSQKPYKIAVEGLHGKPTIADVGGGKYCNDFESKQKAALFQQFPFNRCQFSI